MEELSIKEKAKRYDEAIKRARNIVNSINVGLIGKDSFEVVFPELAESEDEKIRKELIRAFQSLNTLEVWNGIKRSDIIAWLEAQGEQKSTDKVALMPTWSKEDERDFDVIYGIIYNSCNAEDASRLIAWLLSLKPQSQWKPSIAQLNALSIVSKGNAPDDIEEIKTLYEDLKKLREEKL